MLLHLRVDTRLLAGNAAAIRTAAECLRAGGLVAFPTETVYGLGADAADAEAVARLYAAKGRPAFNPLIAHVVDAEAAKRLARFDAVAEQLVQAFWPGPLTLVLPKAVGCPVSDLATAGLDTIAVRAPAHPIAQELLRAVGSPLVAPSANRSGHVSPTTAAHVLDDLAGAIDLVLDGGPTAVGLESTIVGCVPDGPVLLRPGGISRAEIETALGESLAAGSHEAAAAGPPQPNAPGQLASHYAPRAQVRLDAVHVAPGEALLAFGAALPPGSDHARLVRNLSPAGRLTEAAANLFGHLRALDASSAETIAVMPIPDQGLGEAIMDRLKRAAAGR